MPPQVPVVPMYMPYGTPQPPTDVKERPSSGEPVLPQVVPPGMIAPHPGASNTPGATGPIAIPATAAVGPGTAPPPPPAVAATTPSTITQTNQQPDLRRQLELLIGETWCDLGRLAENVGQYETGMTCFENALKCHVQSANLFRSLATCCRQCEAYSQAIEAYRTVLSQSPNDGDSWAALGHCFLMTDELSESYSAYQQALYHTDRRDPWLWYGIGILYDRYGSLDYAEEAFAQVLELDPQFDKAHEVYFRLGIIYKQQQRFQSALECFWYVLNKPPQPLTAADLWFQIGSVHEQQHSFDLARQAYERVLQESPNHAKVLQQLGWLYHQQGQHDQAIAFLSRSLEYDSADAQSWYLLGRCYISQSKYSKAYEAYQQAVYRDARNPTFWCSIGVLYYQISQYRDALDAYSRAIGLNPYIFEAWYDLGTLYESCNKQIGDALYAYQRALRLDPSNTQIEARIEHLKAQLEKSQQGEDQQATDAQAQDDPPPPEPQNPRMQPQIQQLPPQMRQNHPGFLLGANNQHPPVQQNGSSEQGMPVLQQPVMPPRLQHSAAQDGGQALTRPQLPAPPQPPTAVRQQPEETDENAGGPDVVQPPQPEKESPAGPVHSAGMNGAGNYSNESKVAPPVTPPVISPGPQEPIRASAKNEPSDPTSNHDGAGSVNNNNKRHSTSSDTINQPASKRPKPAEEPVRQVAEDSDYD